MARVVEQGMSATHAMAVGMTWITHPEHGNRSVEDADLQGFLDDGWEIKHASEATDYTLNHSTREADRTGDFSSGLVWMTHPTEGNRNVERSAVDKWLARGYAIVDVAR